MRVFERVPYEVVNARMREEPNTVRWVDTSKGSGIRRSRRATKNIAGSEPEGFANFSATPLPELVKLMSSLVAMAQRDPESWCVRRERGANDQIAMMRTDISRAYLHDPSKEEKHVELPSEMWQSEFPEDGRLRDSLHGTRDAPANWEDAYANVLTEHGVAVPRVRVHAVPKNVGSGSSCTQTISCLEAPDCNWNVWTMPWRSISRRSTP